MSKFRGLVMVNATIEIKDVEAELQTEAEEEIRRKVVEMLEDKGFAVDGLNIVALEDIEDKSEVIIWLILIQEIK